jgi:hypothetical protein
MPVTKLLGELADYFLELKTDVDMLAGASNQAVTRALARRLRILPVVEVTKDCKLMVVHFFD